jgi:hypothetical protein
MLLQVEVAFKEQMAGQNSLLLLTHLALSIMESQLRAAAADVQARRVQVAMQHGNPDSCNTPRAITRACLQD